MEQVEEGGLLGCFALTEKLAGVQSGLIVQTRAEYDEATGTFLLNNTGKTEGAYKNWISQGFVADKAVVLADLTVGGERKGPHAFLMDLRQNGELCPGVSVGDMGIKTTGNDLDNAWIAFDNVRLLPPLIMDAILARFLPALGRSRRPGLYRCASHTLLSSTATPRSAIKAPTRPRRASSRLR